MFEWIIVWHKLTTTEVMCSQNLSLPSAFKTINDTYSYPKGYINPTIESAKLRKDYCL